MRSPLHALLWELWRVTRVEAAWRLAVPILGGLAALVLFAAAAPNAKDAGAVIALGLVVVPHIGGWVSLPKLNGMRPGFPLDLLYPRPVRTAVFVGVPMAWLAAAQGVMYLLSALLLKAASGYPFPLLPVAAWIATLTLAQFATSWWTRNRVALLVGNMVVGLANFGVGAYLLTAEEIPGFDWPPNRWPAIFDFPLAYYALMSAVGLASFLLAIAGVARQRHGDAPSAIPWTAGTDGYPDWIRNLLRFPCPTSSATRAQVWFDLKSSGLTVLTIGAVLAIVNPLVFAVSVPVAIVRPFAAMCGMFSVLAVLIFGGNAFGIRARKTRAFEATQPFGTARLAGLKVLVRSACVLTALVAVGVSVWASMSFIAVGENYQPLIGYQPLRSWQTAIESAVGALTAAQEVALAVVVSIGIAVLVASLAALRALVTRYPGRLGIVGWLLLFHGVVLVLLVMTGYRGFGSVALWEFLLDALVWMTRWIDTPAIVLATVYVFWNAFTERLLTPRQAGATLLVSAAFAAAWLTMLRAAGVSLGDMTGMDAVWMLSPALLPLMASVMAPLSLDRIRHT